MERSRGTTRSSSPPRQGRRIPGRFRGRRGGPPRGNSRRRGLRDRKDDSRMKLDIVESAKISRPKTVCWNYATRECEFGDRCRYTHTMKRMGSFEAHKGGVLSGCQTMSVRGLEVFTGGSDCTLKSWWFDTASYQLNCATTTQFDSEVTAVACSPDLLVCGLRSGLIAACLRASGEATQLREHSSAVYAVCIVENVIISGSFDGTIKLWRCQGSSFSFSAAHTLNLNKRIICLQPLTVTDSADPSRVEDRLLWVGGEMLCIVDLHTQSVRTMLSIGDQLVVSIIAYESSVIVGLATGGIKIYSAYGQEMCEKKGSGLYCLRGFLGPSGPVLLAGDQDTVTLLTLPDLEASHQLVLRSHSLVKVVLDLPGAFVTGFKDGNLQLWRLENQRPQSIL